MVILVCGRPGVSAPWRNRDTRSLGAKAQQGAKGMTWGQTRHGGEQKPGCEIMIFNNPVLFSPRHGKLLCFLSRGLGRRIHGSVEDTKLSTNKQHSLSCLPPGLREFILFSFFHPSQVQDHISKKQSTFSYHMV